MELSDAEKYLTSHDPVLGELIARHGHLPMRPRHGNYEALARSIIGQQISVRAAATIFERFEQATALRPEAMLELDDERIRQIGLSGQKARYLHDLALHFVENPAVFDHLDSLHDDDVVIELTRIKGIGVWTAQMFLLFTLQRPDIFAPGDRGLQLAIESLYRLPAKSSDAALLAIATRWQPYRSTASLHLWRSLDNTP